MLNEISPKERSLLCEIDKEIFVIYSPSTLRYAPYFSFQSQFETLLFLSQEEARYITSYGEDKRRIEYTKKNG